MANPPTKKRSEHPTAYRSDFSNELRAASCELSLSPPIHSVIPRNAQRPRLHRNDNRVPVLKPVKIIHIHRQPLDMLPRPPRMDQQSPASPHNSLHIEFTLDRGRV